jgi:hypothetical protein
MSFDKKSKRTNAHHSSQKMHTTPEQKPQFVGMEKMEQPFVEHVLQAYRRHKKLDAISLEYSEFLRYLIAHQVISTRALRRFTLGYDFQDLRRRGLAKTKPRWYASWPAATACTKAPFGMS